MSEKVIFVDFSSEKRAKSTILTPKTRFFSVLGLKTAFFSFWRTVGRSLKDWVSIHTGTLIYPIILSVLYVYVHIVVYYRVYIRENFFVSRLGELTLLATISITYKKG